MRQEYVAVIAILGLSSCIFHAHAQDILYPGETERPSRFPLNTTPGNRPTQFPTNNPGQVQPTTPPSNNQNGGTITQEQYNNCVDNCKFTSEYNPVCGSDGVAYKNIGAFNCAVNCGNPIQNLGMAPCSTTTPSPVTQPPNNQNGGTITDAQYNACVDDCPTTIEYNPVCGSDGAIYNNPGSINCAINCGNPIQNLGYAPCDQYFSTTTAGF